MELTPILAILRSVVHGTAPELTEPVNPVELYRTALKQNLLPVLAYADRNWHMVEEPQVSSQLKKVLHGTLFQNMNRCALFNRLSEQLTAAGIRHMPVKGYYLRELYPLPEIRTFGDIDVLIHPEDRKKADRLMREAGYEVLQDWEPTYNYRKGIEYYEFHTNLMDGNLDDRSDLCAYFADAWNHGRIAQGLRYAPAPEFHLIYVICHLGKHLYHGGAGLRMYLDVALYLRRYDAELDWAAVEEEFRRLKLETFFHTVMQAACLWFDVQTRCPLPQADEKSLEELLTYTLDADLFGHLRNHAAINVRNEKSQSKQKVLAKMLFPPAAQIENRYPFLRGKHWLLPVAWGARLADNIALVPKRLKEMREVSQADRSEVTQYDDFMNRIGL